MGGARAHRGLINLMQAHKMPHTNLLSSRVTQMSCRITALPHNEKADMQGASLPNMDRLLAEVTQFAGMRKRHEQRHEPSCKTTNSLRKLLVCTQKHEQRHEPSSTRTNIGRP